ncbi:hypothetical protein HDU76_002371 [Blyttiomyces sp. JEL0837]|nr:hypothetical protein HDU76_002371 [Blyttiomyces sp. JEL0837]
MDRDRITSNEWFSLFLQGNETFETIAELTGVSLETIKTLNPFLASGSIKKNEVVCLQTKSAAAASFALSSDCTSSYTAISGDSCMHVAFNNKLSLTALKNLNPTVDCDNVQNGQQFCIASATQDANTTPPSATSGCTKQSTIQGGDICYDIAGKNNITLKQLLDLNSGLDCLNLQIGQQICVAGTPSSSTASNNGFTQDGYTACSTPWVVKQGDTCYDIARQSHITLTELLNANGGIDCFNLQISQSLCVPVGAHVDTTTTTSTAQDSTSSSTPTPTTSAYIPCTKPWIIKEGDTCYAIAQASHVTLTQLLDANSGVDCLSLQIGQSLCVPAGAVAGTETPTSTITYTPTSTPSSSYVCPQSYTIVAGDTCYDLAVKHLLTVSQFIALNDGIECINLQIGQSVCVSDGGESASSTTPTTSAIATTTSAPLYGCGESYTIVAGDTCYDLAVKHEITVGQLIGYNNGIECLNLQIGQVICVKSQTDPSATSTESTQPTSTPTTAPTTCENSYTIQAGDLCVNLAHDLSISLDDFEKLNPGIVCDDLQIGQVVCIPKGVQLAQPAPMDQPVHDTPTPVTTEQAPQPTTTEQPPPPTTTEQPPPPPATTEAPPPPPATTENPPPVTTQAPPPPPPSTGLSASQQAALDAGNAERARYNVPAQSWSSDLAAQAQGVSDLLAFQYNCALHHTQGGQNLFATWSTAPIGDAVDLVTGVQAFVSEGSPGAGQFNHWTQVVWRDSTSVGCAVSYNTNTAGAFKYCKVVTCHYSPAGNVIGQAPF